MRLPARLNARLSLLLLVFGMVLVAANFIRNREWIQERRIKRFEDESSSLGVRLSGMMQHLVRRGLVPAAELEMSYAAVTPHVELGLVCDASDKVRFATRLEWAGASLAETPLADAAALVHEVRNSMTPRLELSPERALVTGVFPFYESYHSRNRGVVLLRFDMSDALSQATHDALRESLAQACALVALCLLLWLALDLIVTRRVQQLASYAASAGAGSDLPAVGAEHDELAVVARSFEDAVNKLRATELRLLEASEAERRRIGADLHDDVCQRMAAAQLKSGVLKSALAREGHPQTGLAGAVADELAKAARVARGFAHGLAPMLVQRGRLPYALKELAATMAESFMMSCEASCDLGSENLGLWVDTHVYRIVQEMLANAAKHGNASCVTIEIKVTERLLRIQVDNDGKTFEQNVGSGIGLELLKQRVRALGGHWGIGPRAGELGTGSTAWCEVMLESRHYVDEG